MRETENHIDSEIRLWQEKLFARSVRRSHKLTRLSELIGTATNLQCLEISAGDGVISARLRSLGGSWKTVVTSANAADSVGCFVKENILQCTDGKLPFDDHTFDHVVIVDALREIPDDYEFMHECHRVLKNDGWVYISSTRRIPLSMTAFTQRIFGLLPMAEGAQRNGYKEAEIFNILKDGFDVPETIFYSNDLMEAVATIFEFFKTRIAGGPYWMLHEVNRGTDVYRNRRLYRIAAFAYPLLSLLSIFEFIPGHRMLIKSRRRHWSPRLQPKLIDGRSIAEATINTKIGTAAPF